jgi:hypothetical protein
MTAVTKVRCPACKSLLRIPTEALSQSIRCERCDRRFRATLKKKPVNSPPAPPTAGDAPIALDGSPLAADTSGVPEWPAAADDVFAFDSPAASELDFDVAPVAPIVRYQQQRKSATRRAIDMVGVGLVLLATVGAGFYVRSRTGPPDEGVTPVGPDGGTVVTATTAKSPPKPVDLPTATDFPRRFLAVCVHNYLYANPTSPRADRTGLADVLRVFAKDRLRADPSQIYILSDAAPGKQSRAPVKPVIEQTIDRFLATCRRQDRIMVVFVGHAVDLDDQPYFVPLDGELTVKESLIPVQWLYDRLAACPARQKVVIMDVCRDDAARGNDRPGSGPMGPKVDAALANPPAGVQVLTACVAGQMSHEYDFALTGNFDVKGGAFLSLLTQAPRAGWGLPKPDEPLPIGLLVDRVKEPLAHLVAARDKAVQTVRLAGTEPAEPGDGAAFNAGEPLPTRFEMPRGASGIGGGLADPKLVRSILAEIALPPMKPPREPETAVQADDELAKLATVVPFRADAMKGYEADYADVREILDKGREYPLRVAVIRAVDALGKLARSGKGQLMDEFRGQATDDVKKSITESQKEGPARLVLELQEALDELEKVADHRAVEKSKRWRAHYDYITAQVKARMAHVQEYNLMLGRAKRDELPPLDAKLHNGWRLASQEKMQSPKEIKDLATESKKLLNQIIRENPGTPWEVLAKRDRFVALGLAWQPANFGQ